jgi:hypothetical protein
MSTQLPPNCFGLEESVGSTTTGVLPRTGTCAKPGCARTSEADAAAEVAVHVHQAAPCLVLVGCNVAAGVVLNAAVVGVQVDVSLRTAGSSTEVLKYLGSYNHS